MLSADYRDDNGNDVGHGDDENDNGGGGDKAHDDDFDYGDGDTTPLAVHRPPVLSSEDIDHDMMARKHCEEEYFDAMSARSSKSPCHRNQRGEGKENMANIFISMASASCVNIFSEDTVSSLVGKQ